MARETDYKSILKFEVTIMPQTIIIYRWLLQKNIDVVSVMYLFWSSVGSTLSLFTSTPFACALWGSTTVSAIPKQLPWGEVALKNPLSDSAPVLIMCNAVLYLSWKKLVQRFCAIKHTKLSAQISSYRCNLQIILYFRLNTLLCGLEKNDSIFLQGLLQNLIAYKHQIGKQDVYHKIMCVQ